MRSYALIDIHNVRIQSRLISSVNDLLECTLFGSSNTSSYLQELRNLT